MMITCRNGSSVRTFSPRSAIARPVAMQRRVLVALALSGLLITAHCGVLVVDSRENAYLTGNSDSKWSKHELHGLIAALTGLQPGSEIDSAASQQIASVVKANPFKKPQAHLALTLAGMSLEELSSLFAGRQQVAVSLEEDEHIADSMLELFTSLAAANPDVPFQLLDKLAAKNCRGANCVEQYMPAIAESIGAEYKSATNQLVLADGTELDLSELADKAFATELLSARAGVQNLLTAMQQHGAQDVAVMDLTMLGLQGLAAKYGAGSAEAVAGKEAMTQVLQWAVKQLDEQFNGDVTVQVAVFDKSPSAESVDSAMAWKEQRHSRMLLAAAASNDAWPGPDEEAQAQQFATKAAAYGGFILLLYFILGGVYCLCNMPFKKDSLLYGSKKE